MFLRLDSKDKEAMALIDSEGGTITYGGILMFAEKFRESIKGRMLVFILSRNCVGSAAGYLGALINQIVPLMLKAGIDQDLLKTLVNIYRPAYIWKPVEISPHRPAALCYVQRIVSSFDDIRFHRQPQVSAALLWEFGGTGKEHLGLF